jgi:hypothetical protein
MENQPISKFNSPRRDISYVRFFRLLKLFSFEAAAWISGLLILFLISPGYESHFNLCLFKNIGLDFCPGCGMGRSISYLLHGDFSASFKSHPLGAIAVAVLSFRIYSLIKRQIQNFQSI